MLIVLTVLPWMSCIAPGTRDGGKAPREDAALDRPVDESSLMRAAIERFTTDVNDLRKFYSAPGSQRGFERMENFLASWRQRLEIIDFSALDQQGRIDYILLRLDIEHREAQLRAEKNRWEQTSPLMPFASRIVEMEETRWELRLIDPREAAGSTDAIAKSVKEIRKFIDEHRRNAAPDAAAPVNAARDASATGLPIPLTPVVAARAASQIDALRSTLRSWFHYHEGFQPEFSWWVRKPYEVADQALDEYARFLREEVAGLKGKDDDPLIGDPIGAEALAADLKHEMMPYSPAELIGIAEAQLAWCEEQMRRASAELGFDDWRQSLEHVKGRHVPPGQQAELVARFALEAIEFIDRHDLVTVPPLCRETWRLEMIDERRQRVLPFAVYGGQHMGVAYAMQNMDHDRKLMSMRGNNMHFTRIVTPHELIPGHHLQGFMSDRYRPYRKLFTTPFYIEGWALHWEMLLWDMDYARGPEDRIGMLFWRMHRAARIIVSLGFHLGRMTPQEMIDFLVQRIGHERENAISEVRRYIGGEYSPLYQCGYLIGGLQLHALHAQLVPARMTHRQFHDAVLKLGPIPIEMVRASLIDVPLTPRYEACWRFQEEVIAVEASEWP